MKKEIFKVIHDKKYNFWTIEEDRKLLEQVKISDARNKWKKISRIIGKKVIDCIKRYKVINPKIKKGLWTPEEDREVIELSRIYGTNWAKIAENLKTKNRTGKQIRQRYLNFLEPSINRSKFTLEEDLKILKLFQSYKTNWKFYVKHFQHRSSDMIKGRYYSSVRYNVKILNIVDTLKTKENHNHKSFNKNIIVTNENEKVKNESIANNTTPKTNINMIPINSNQKDKIVINNFIKNKQIFRTKKSKINEKKRISKRISINNIQEITESLSSLNFKGFDTQKNSPNRDSLMEDFKELSSIEKRPAKDSMDIDDIDFMLQSDTIIIPEFLKEMDRCNTFTESLDDEIDRVEYRNDDVFINNIKENPEKQLIVNKNELEIKFLNQQTCEETDEFFKDSEEAKCNYENEYDHEFNMRFNYFEQKNSEFLI